ncbi:hypothetical protein [Polaribacter sp. Asnod1-A03]|uniref:hypothetical protein n=1 Tax=Polaribacter sp. Asnod1-A03 TaxID=3160581 RepID=UPI003869EAB9
MTKQQKTYGLLILVLIIWGMIGYQFYMRLNPSTPELASQDIQTRFKRKQVVEQSFYVLKEAYRDPFLGGFPKKKITRKKSIVPEKSIIPFPNVEYNGIIKGNGSKLYILTINRKQEIVKIGAFFEGVKLIKATDSTVLVRFNKETKKIVKQ